MKAHLLPSSVCCILLCSVSLPIALTSILPPLPLGSLLVHQNLTDVGSARCAFTSEWSSRDQVVKKRDCYGAIDRLKVHAQTYGRQKFEFFKEPGQRQTGFPHVDTPGCYDVGECAVCLAMLTDFSKDKSRSIPRLPPEPWATHEVADAGELLKAAQLVGDACVRDANAYGWAPVGARQNLGVFIWAGGSALEQDVSRPGGLENTSLLLPGYKPSDQLPATITS